MKDDELWLKKIKERLDDYSEPLPDAGWERLEKALPTSAPMSVVGTKKKILFRRWAMTAAAGGGGGGWGGCAGGCVVRQSLVAAKSGSGRCASCGRTGFSSYT